MGWSKEVSELLQQGREQAAADLVAAHPRALRPLVGRLWDPDRQVRHCAARAVGLAAAARPERGREIVRRLLWSLNDEAGTNGIYGVPALGEIGRCAPEMFAPFVAPLVSTARDGNIRLELLRALRRIAETAPALVAGQLERLAFFVDDSRDDEREAYDRLVEAVEKEPDLGA
jgi:hypothetical protein